MPDPKYIKDRLDKFISDGEVVLRQYNQKGNIDKHDIWITEVMNFFSVIAPEYNQKLNNIADKLGNALMKEPLGNALMKEPYGRAAYNYIQQQIEVIRSAKSLLTRKAKSSKVLKGKKGRQKMAQELKGLKANEIWSEIERDYVLTKRAFGIKINFVSDKFVREIIFRDVGQAYMLAKIGFPKPAVILAGSVIEELLRLYLKHKNITTANKTFDGYIKACKDNDLLKSAVYSLTDSVRHFRNHVHLAKEKNKKYSISVATAKGAVSSIFTLANDFD
jgi:hypothetical protein